MSNKYGLSLSEKEAVEKLQQRMKNEVFPEHFREHLPFVLWRYLKARNFDLDKAEHMLRKTLTWRKSFQVDTILEDFKPMEYFLKYIQPTLLGYTKEGNPVQYCPSGNVECKDILKCSTINEYVKHWIWHSESMAKEVQKHVGKMNKISYGIILIMQMDELTLSNATNKYVIDITSRIIGFLSDHYPESVKAIYIINAPYFYVAIFNMIKSIMSREMIQKIHIHGHDGWKKKLLDDVGPDILPAFLGGNRTDPDGNPLCKTIMRSMGGRFPEKYYLTDKDRTFKDEGRVKKVIISPKRKKEIEVHVTESGSRIEWEFLLDKDIGFGLFFKVQEEETTREILPIQKYDTVGGTEVGIYRTLCTGKYIIIFDNSHSWMTSKEVKYCITVLKPDGPS